MPLRLQILVAEDNPDCALSLANLLRLCGHQRVQVVSDGASALAALGEGEFDVILLDLGLPIIDGWEVARRIRAMPLRKRPLIVAVTGFGRAEDRQRSADAGIDVHLLKPSEPRQLLNLLASLANRDQDSDSAGACLTATA
jgi:CheY-like chemotaxis protein